MVLKAVALSISHTTYGDGLPALFLAVVDYNQSLAEEMVKETIEDSRSERRLREKEHDEDCLDRQHDRSEATALTSLRSKVTYFTWGFTLVGTLLSFAGYFVSKDPFWLLGTAFSIGGPVAVTAIARNTRIVVGKVEDADGG